MPKIKILNSSGHTELLLEGQEAIEAIEENTVNGEWVFVDGKYITLDDVSKECLENVCEVVITPALQAG